MPGSTLIIRTPRLDIVATTLARLDAELTARDSAAPHPLAVLLDARVPASWPPGTYDVDAMRFFRERLIADGPAGVGWYGWYAITRASGESQGVLVASGGFFGPPIGDAVEIGYSVVPEHRGHGIATELIVALTERALGAPGVRCVVAHTAEVNVASQKALRHAGFERLGAGPEAGTLRFERRALPPNESCT